MNAVNAFKITPAETTMIFFHFLMPSIERSGGISTPSSSSIPSPYIETYPPRGIALIEKYVSPPLRFFFKMAGPNPIEYSWQYTLKSLAIERWPAS